jgi:hypothetical protein
MIGEADLLHCRVSFRDFVDCFLVPSDVVAAAVYGLVRRWASYVAVGCLGAAWLSTPRICHSGPPQN